MNNGDVVKAEDLMREEEKLFEKYSGFHGKRRLVLLLADNSFEAVSLYRYHLKRKNPILLLDASVERLVLDDIISRFVPDEIDGRDVGSDHYSEWTVYGHFHLCISKDFSKRLKKYAEGIAVLLSTSGSTGGGKFVKLTYQNLKSNAGAIVKSLEIERGDRGALLVPMAYAYGLSVVNSHLLAGGTLLLPKGNMTQKSYWDFLEKNRVQSFCGVPYTYEWMFRLRIFERKWQELKLLTQAGGSMSVSMKKKLLLWSDLRKRRGNKTDIAIMYGQTEATARMGTFFLNRHPEKLESSGKAIPGGRFFIDRPDENGNGEIVYCGENVCEGYARDRLDLLEKEKRKKGKKKILYTGDMGWLDKEGYLYITGRKKRFVKIRGNRMSLDLLQMHLTELFKRETICVSSDVRADEEEKIYICVSEKTEDILLLPDGEKILPRAEEMELLKREMRKLHFTEKDYQVEWDRKILHHTNGKVDYHGIQTELFGK